jgi:hypothetical protein
MRMIVRLARPTMSASCDCPKPSRPRAALRAFSLAERNEVQAQLAIEAAHRRKPKTLSRDTDGIEFVGPFLSRCVDLFAGEADVGCGRLRGQPFPTRILATAS